MAARMSKNIAEELLDFLNAAPTPFHVVLEAQKRLQKAGFVQLSEREQWVLKKGCKYFFTRNFSSIVAFVVGNRYEPGNGFVIIGAHTDSPALKLKPISKITKGEFLEVGVQTYGGGLWHTWFDRDLTVAGRVLVKRNGETDSSEPGFSQELVRIDRPILRVPTLAIHLDRTQADDFKFNNQTQLVPVLATAVKAQISKLTSLSPADINGTPADGGGKEEKRESDDAKHHPLLMQLLAEELVCQPGDICDFELQVCDTQPAVLGGALKEFVFSGRLDNLCMSFCSLKALLDSTAAADSLEEETGVRMVALFDHEEVGSDSAQGAGSPILIDALRRITSQFNMSASANFIEQAIQQSYLVSADMAHCLHPNYQEKHDDNHQPMMHKGLVIKHNANQRYATNSLTAFLFQEIGRRNNLPSQEFVVRNDMACGSTIGPILASGVGIRTVDVGAPQLSMHSIREVCGVDDVAYSYLHFKAVFEEFAALDRRIGTTRLI